MKARFIVKNSLKLFLISLSSIHPEKTIPILLYHSIDNSGREDSVSPENFSKHMEYLYKNNYRVISLDDTDKYIGNSCKRKIHKVLAITFDDGYKSVYKTALPILQKYGFPATVFIPTKYVGKTSEWIDQSIPLLTWDEILIMNSKGISFGSHGHSHQDLTDMSHTQAKHELELSRKLLEEKLQSPVISFSYPYSKSNEYIENITLECGYKMLFSAINNERGTPKNSFPLLRRSVMRDDKSISFTFLLSNTYQYYFDIKKLAGLF